MALKQIPIVASATPIPPGTSALDLNQLATILFAHFVGSISANVDFFQKGAVDPSSDVGIFWNTASKVWKIWDSGQGRYLPITNLKLGQLQMFANAGDDLAGGWVVLNGRNINAITGLAAAQKAYLESKYGVGANIPNAQFLVATDLPEDGSFADIDVPAVTPTEIAPAAGVIDGLTISNPPTQAEVTALRDKTAQLRDSAETLRESTDGERNAIVNVRNMSETLLIALNGANSGGADFYTNIWVGYP